MIRKNAWKAVLLLLTLTFSSCFLWHDKNRADRGRRFPHDAPKQEKKPYDKLRSLALLNQATARCS